MNKYKTFEELKEELGDKFEEYMYKANIELLNKLDKIKEIPLRHINNASEELRIILRNSNDLEYKNQCSHDFEIIRKNVDMIYIEIDKLLEEIE